MPIKILHVLGTMDPGGVETWLMYLLRNMDRDQLQFHFCTCGLQPGLYATEVEGLSGKIFPCPIRPNLWAFGHRFRKILRNGNYDVVHSHVHFFSGALLSWANAVGVPIRIAHSHNTNDGKSRTIPRRLYRRVMRSLINRYATHGLAASRPAAAELFGDNWQHDSRVQVHYYGIDLDPFRRPLIREEVRRELGIPPDVPVVGHVGRFEAQKNHQFLLDIAREILKARPDVHFLLVGEGPLRSRIEAQAVAMDLSGRIHFTGTRTDVPSIMRAAMDVFVFPSLWEGLPVAVIEAQAAGLQCIVSERITAEASILPEQVIHLPASKTPEDWAVRTLNALGRAKVPGELAVGAISKTNFSVQQGISYLSALYGSTRELQTRANSIRIS